MRFVSRASRYSFVARPTITPEESYQRGVKPQTGIVCNFRQIGHAATPWEQEAALRTFEFRGLAIGEDPLRRLGYYDTEVAARENGWDEGTKVAVEERLLTGMSYGVDYLRVEKPQLTPPWPTYDKLTVQGRRTAQHVAEQIAATAGTTGIDPGLVIAYERENANRPEVIAAVQALLTKDAEPEAELVEA